MELDGNTIIVIFVVVALLAIAAFAFRKNAFFEMFGVKFRTKDNAAAPGDTSVGEDVKVRKGAEIGSMTGTEGATGEAAMSGNVKVGNRAEVEGKIGRMTGRKVGAGTSSEGEDV